MAPEISGFFNTRPLSFIVICKTFGSSEHISEETCLRQFKRSKEQLMKLAADCDYSSDKLTYLLSLINTKEETKDPKDYDSDEVRKFI